MATSLISLADASAIAGTPPGPPLVRVKRTFARKIDDCDVWSNVKRTPRNFVASAPAKSATGTRTVWKIELVVKLPAGRRTTATDLRVTGLDRVPLRFTSETEKSTSP